MGRRLWLFPPWKQWRCKTLHGIREWWGGGEHFGCCPENILLWTFVKAGFQTHPEGLTGKEEEAAGQAGPKSDWLCFHAQVCFAPSCSAACVTGPAHSHRQREAENCFAGAGDGKGSTGDGQASADNSIWLFSLQISTQPLQLGGAALLAWCFVEEMHDLSPYTAAAFEEQLVLSARTLVPVSLPNSSGENYLLLKVSTFPLLSFNSLIACYSLLQTRLRFSEGWKDPAVSLTRQMYLRLCYEELCDNTTKAAVELQSVWERCRWKDFSRYSEVAQKTKNVIQSL